MSDRNTNKQTADEAQSVMWTALLIAVSGTIFSEWTQTVRSEREMENLERGQQISSRLITQRCQWESNPLVQPTVLLFHLTKSQHSL